MSYSAKEELARRFGANQELAAVINRLLQAHEREMRARMLVEISRSAEHPDPVVEHHNARALDTYAQIRQAAVVEVCDTIRDQVLDVLTEARDRAARSPMMVSTSTITRV